MWYHVTESAGSRMQHTNMGVSEHGLSTKRNTEPVDGPPPTAAADAQSA